MLKAGTETASLMNHFFSTSSQPEPKVGMGATILGWTDRHAGTIIKVTPSQIHVQQDTATRTDTNGMSEMQTYRFEPNPTGKVHIFRKTKRGFRANGYGLAVGARSEYYDYSF